jgi:predicted transcriptional regulator
VFLYVLNTNLEEKISLHFKRDSSRDLTRVLSTKFFVKKLVEPLISIDKERHMWKLSRDINR